jgi:hypothetical protein
LFINNLGLPEDIPEAFIKKRETGKGGVKREKISNEK